MKIGQKKTEIATRHLKTLCDICKRDVEQVAKEDKNATGYQEVRFEARIGENNPWEDGDLRTTYSIDLCHRCFLDTVRPAIEKLGGKFRVEEMHDHVPYYGVVLEEGETYKEPTAVEEVKPERDPKSWMGDSKFVLLNDREIGLQPETRSPVELVSGPDAYNLFLLVEVDKQLLRVFPQNVSLWNAHARHLNEILSKVGYLILRSLITKELIMSACALIQTEVLQRIHDGRLAHMQAWRETFKVLPVKLAPQELLGREPFGPRLIPYE